MSEPKKETVRINLPPRPGQPGKPPIKRETVRITLPSKPGLGTPVGSNAPKKESAKMAVSSDAKPPQAEGAGSSAPKPPPSPPAGLKPPPAPPQKPAPGPSSEDKPDPASQTIPLGKPTPPPAAPAGGSAPKPPPAAPPSAAAPSPPPAQPAKPAEAAKSDEAAQPADPAKKKTSRIQLPKDAPPGAASKSLPKATVKLQQTQPLTRGQPAGKPGAALSQDAQAPASGGADTLTTVLSVAALVGALAALASQILFMMGS